MTEGHTYPLRAPVGGEELTLRLLGPEDTAAVVAFARTLPEHDLLFLARDITEPEAVADWMADANITTIGAFRAEALAGYAAIHRNQRRWSAHVAELRVMVGLDLRGQGLGRLLTQEAFAFCLSTGAEKMMAQMTLDQKGAIEVFESLGFRPEALLRDHVRDRDGKKHDLLVLSHEVARFAAQRAAYGVSEAFGQA